MLHLYREVAGFVESMPRDKNDFDSYVDSENPSHCPASYLGFAPGFACRPGTGGPIRTGKARSSLSLALISRSVSSSMLAGLKLGGEERGGNCLNVVTNF